MPPVDRAGYERSVTATRVQLGGQTFAAAQAQGRTMTPKQVLAGPSSAPHLPKASTSLNGLTDREVEVLCLSG